MTEVLLHVRPFAGREGGLLQSLPWSWRDSPLAKRDCFARLGGRGYPLGEQRHASSFHLLLDAVRSELRVDINRVYVFNEATGDDGDTIVLGSCVLLERRLPSAEELGVEDWRVRDAGSRVLDEDVADPLEAGQIPCRCAVDEAIGLALALGLESLQVERSVWEGAARRPKYAMLRSQLRICITEESGESDGQEDSLGRLSKALQRAERRTPVLAPWELQSADEVLQLRPEEKALSALSAGVVLPSAEKILGGSDDPAVADDFLTALMEPLCDVSVRCELRARRALAGDEPIRAFSESSVFSAADPEMFTLSTVLERCGRLRRQIDVAVAAEDFSTAARRQAELEAETEYLDELLEEMPSGPAFRTSAAEAAEEALTGGDDSADVFESAGDDWFEQIRRTERERRLELDFSMALIDDLRGRLPFAQLLRLLDSERERYRRKEQALWEASAARRQERRRWAEATSAQADVYGAADDRGADEYDAEVDDHDAAWSDEIAPRVARQLVFTLSDGARGADGVIDGCVVPSRQPGLPAKPSIGASVREAVGQLEKLLEAAERGDVEAAGSLRRLARLTRRLEDLQRRRRSGTYYQTADQRGLEEERRALVEEMRECAQLDE